MPRGPLILTSRFPYHVTNRSNNKEWFYVPIKNAWAIFQEVLSRCEDRYKIQIHAFTLMSNHYHLMFTAPLMNMSLAIRYFQTETSRSIQKESGRINHIFGGRYKWSLLHNPSAIAYAYKYIGRNPVVAGLCETVENYPYSTFGNLDGYYNKFGLSEGYSSDWSYIPRNEVLRYEWLNQPTPKEHEKIISLALRKRVFAFSRGKEITVQIQQLSNFYQIPLPSLIVGVPEKELGT